MTPSDFSRAEASYLAAPEGVEAIIEPVDGGEFFCEREGCYGGATLELSWPMEDHDLASGIFCQECFNDIEASGWDWETSQRKSEPAIEQIMIEEVR